MRRPIVAESPDHDGDDEVRDAHERCADEQQRAATEAVHGPEGGDDADELGDVYDAGEDELHGVVLAEGFEEGGGVV
jgi:hypothetical protein